MTYKYINELSQYFAAAYKASSELIISLMDCHDIDIRLPTGP